MHPAHSRSSFSSLFLTRRKNKHRNPPTQSTRRMHADLWDSLWESFPKVSLSSFFLFLLHPLRVGANHFVTLSPFPLGSHFFQFFPQTLSFGTPFPGRPGLPPAVATSWGHWPAPPQAPWARSSTPSSPPPLWGIRVPPYRTSSPFPVSWGVLVTDTESHQFCRKPGELAGNKESFDSMQILMFFKDRAH